MPVFLLNKMPFDYDGYLRKPLRDMEVFKKAISKSLYRIVQSVLTD